MSNLIAQRCKKRGWLRKHEGGLNRLAAERRNRVVNPAGLRSSSAPASLVGAQKTAGGRPEPQHLHIEINHA
jgi:hypothetical protein